MSESWYPIFLNLRGRACLVVGGGEVALRKAESLREAGAKVRVVAPQVCGDILRLKDVEVRLREYEAADVAGMALVIGSIELASGRIVSGASRTVSSRLWICSLPRLSATCTRPLNSLGKSLHPHNRTASVSPAVRNCLYVSTSAAWGAFARRTPKKTG